MRHMASRVWVLVAEAPRFGGERKEKKKPQCRIKWSNRVGKCAYMKPWIFPLHGTKAPAPFDSVNLGAVIQCSDSKLSELFVDTPDKWAYD